MYAGVKKKYFLESEFQVNLNGKSGDLIKKKINDKNKKYSWKNNCFLWMPKMSQASHL